MASLSSDVRHVWVCGCVYLQVLSLTVCEHDGWVVVLLLVIVVVVTMMLMLLCLCVCVCECK